MPKSVLQAAAPGSAVFARVTIQNPPTVHGVSFNVFVNPPEGASGLTPGKPLLRGHD